MESHLDRLAKAVASGVSRRQALRWLGGGLLSLYGLGMARGQAGASCESKCPPVSSAFTQAQRNACLKACVDCQAATNPGTACINPTTGAVVCCRGGRCCGSTCCPNGRICCGPPGGPTCCKGGEICILSAPIAAGGVHSCCKPQNVCGTPPSTTGGGQTCCKDDESCISGACCPRTCQVATTTTAGNVVVTCCLPGQRCVNGRCGLIGGA
jgi:hypothetical protein